MPVKKAAYKALRQSKKHHEINLEKSAKIKKISKQIKKAITENKKEEALKLLKEAYKIIDKAAKRGTINKNTAARKKSRLTKKILHLK